MSFRRWCIALIAASALVAPAKAGQVVISGGVAHENANKLVSQIQWHKSLAQAESDAARQGKMILWIHMLGQMDGAT